MLFFRYLLLMRPVRCIAMIVGTGVVVNQLLMRSVLKPKVVMDTKIQRIMNITNRTSLNTKKKPISSTGQTSSTTTKISSSSNTMTSSIISISILNILSRTTNNTISNMISKTKTLTLHNKDMKMIMKITKIMQVIMIITTKMIKL